MSNTNVLLFEDAIIKKKVIAVWARVFEISNKVIHQHQFYGYFCMDKIPSPNIHTMLNAIKVHHQILGNILDEGKDLLSESDIRLILNAEEQLHRLERVAFSLTTNNRVLFDEYINALETQASF